MGVKSDYWIARMAQLHRMIEPFDNSLHTDGVLSYGLSSAGYDIRVSDEYRIFTNVNTTVIDPKHFDERALVAFTGDRCIIPPNSFVLARSVEYIRMPSNVIAILKPKSTYIRAGILTPSTVLEPGWEGHVTLELANISPLPAIVYSMEGISQIMFFEMDEAPMTNYDDRHGKYQGQVGITLPKV